MTEKNIEHLTSVLLICVLCYYFLNLSRNNSANKSETQNIKTDDQKTIWDKLKIISTILAALSALILAITQAYQSFHK